jgi:[methyl-Co(III) methanol-specific corrinoid protein]:coenzyme M methyltransferase
MKTVGVYFPDAHLDARKMAALGAAGHTVLGLDCIAPVFSVQHEAAALGCNVDWGSSPDQMPVVRGRLYDVNHEVEIPSDFLDRPSCRVVLEALELLRKDCGREVALVGKVFGPWTLSYHLFGTQEFLILTKDDPERVRGHLRRLKEVTVAFAMAQIEAGADALTLADHATGDLCSPQAYREFLAPIHAELAGRIPCPIVLHICGNTHDRISAIAETGVDCFHYDSRVTNARARSLAGRKMSLMGGVNNPQTLFCGKPSEVEKEVREAIEAGIDIVGPECAVPLLTPLENLKAVARAAASLEGDSCGKAGF